MDLKSCYHKFSNKERSLKRIGQTENDNLWIEKIFNTEQNPDEQISLIIKNIEVQPSYHQDIYKICSDLEIIARQFFKREVSVEPFGSGITGLALMRSDIDLFLNFKDALPHEPRKFLKILQKIVGKNGLFFKPFAIYARVPILQCIHATGIKCDISFQNGLGVANSNLIKYLLTLDKRLRPFCLLLKYILKRNGLLGRNGISSFTLLNLIIYFLQQLEKPLLPSLRYMQEATNTKEYINGWNVSFAHNLTFDESNQNHSTIQELLEMFFKFYCSFEFGFYVISPFAGKSYLKTAFSDLSTLPQEFSIFREKVQRSKKQSYKLAMNKVMCVQDFFDHFNNICRNVKLKVLLEFQSFCQQGTKIFANELNKNHESSTSECLKKLLLQRVINSPCKKLKETSLLIHVGSLSFRNLRNLNIHSIEELRRQWAHKVFNKLKDILVKVLKCEVKIENIESDFVKRFESELGYLSLVSKKKRKEARKSLKFNKSKSNLNEEELISNYLLDTLLKNVGKASFKFNITGSVKTGPTHILLNFECKETDFAKKSSCLTIFSFLERVCPILLEPS